MYQDSSYVEGLDQKRLEVVVMSLEAEEKIVKRTPAP